MTIGDYIRGKISIWSVEYSDELISLELSRVGLDSSETITSEVNTDAFFYNVIPDIIAMPTSISEGGFSIGYDKDALLKFYAMTAKKLGKPNLLSENTIVDISNRWG